jgi:quercetin dioxygenase-like cupin family protein
MGTTHRSSTPPRMPAICAALLPALLLTAAAQAGAQTASASGSAQTGAPAGAAAGGALKRTPVLHADVTAPGREAAVMRVELGGNGHAGRHTHPGDEISYVLDGEAELVVDGEAPKRIGPGEAFVVKEGRIHDLRNPTGKPVHLIGVYVVDKGKPIATPAGK